MPDDIELKMLSVEDVLVRRTSNPEVVLLDVRTEEEWEERHIPGATHLPLHRLVQRIASLDPKRETITICEHGVRSVQAARYLLTQGGFSSVSNMVGGMSAWTGLTESEL